MKKQRTPILLILMMLVTPIVSAFDHCSAMDMSSHLLENLHLSMSTMDETVEEQLSKKVDMDCHNNSGCTFHACGGYGLMSASSTINANPALYYSVFEYIATHSNIPPSFLRPPIANL